MSRALVRLTPVLHRRLGLFTAADAEDCDVRPGERSRLVRRGLVERWYVGVYAVVAYPDSWQRRWLAAQLAAGPLAAISHGAAAHLHGLEHVGAGRRPDLALVRPEARGRRRAGPPVRTARHLRPDDVVDLGPFRVTSVAWTLCSLAHRLGVERLERGVEAAVARGAVDHETFAATGRRFACCPGAPVIRAVVGRALPEVRGTRSSWERRLLRILGDAGLPLPEVDVRVIDASGRIRYLDAAYVEERIAIEVDVHPDHDGTLGRRLDGARQNDLVPTWTPLRFDADDLAVHPDRVAAQVRRALAAGR